MALDRDKTRKNAERLLKQGRVQAALEEYQRLAEEAPRDLPLLNLVGDLLSRIGRHRDALPYYDRIAEEYSRSGFFLKAIAILKKVLRNEPDRPDVLLRVGDLYLKQKLPGEARGYLLHAADRFVAARGFREAHEVYRKLVAAEPDDPLHRLRLAETMAAGGDAAGAAGSLVEVAETARGAGRLGEAEKIYRRALDLLPGRPEALSGLARCLGAQGRAAEAVALLARALEARPEASVAVVLVALEGQAGRPAEALRLLTGRFADAMPAEAFESVVRSFAERGESAIAWAALDPLVARWTRDAPERVVALLERLAGVEPDGHLPALERLLDLRGRHADGAGMVATLVAMERAYRSRSMHAEAERIAERLRGLAPAVAQAAGLPAEESGAGVAAAEPAPVQAPAPPAADPAGASAAPIPPEYEAPAVPLGPAEHESVAGRLTQAEIFEKYGLFEQAIEQLKEVTRRYPGLANAQQRLAELLRTRGDRPGLRDALVGLAIACRASGEHDRARVAAEEAARTAPLGSGTRAMLGRLSLLRVEEESQPAVPAPPPATSEEKPVPAPPPEEPPAPAAPPRAVAVTTSPAVPAPPTEPPRAAASPPPAEEDEVVIELEEVPVVEPEVVSASETAPTSPALAAPTQDDLEEIAFYIDQGMVQDARHRIVALRSRGKAGAALDALEARAAAAASSTPERAPVVETADDSTDRSESVLDDEALESISEALVAEAAAAGQTAAAPASFDEQSVEEVFELFKQHVDREIGSEDHRTHYDLGIAYKEMGLLDDAVGEFQVASRAPDLFRDACTMIALCLREKGEVQEAAGWYRQALDAPGGDDEALRGLRFDLAEVLEQCGDTKAALDLFRSIHRDDPSYREVGRKIAELESRGR